MKKARLKQIIEETINNINKKSKLNEQVLPDEGCENLIAFGNPALMCESYLAGTLMPASDAPLFAEYYNLEFCCQGFEAGPNIYDEITEDDPCYVCASSITSSNPVLQAQAQSLADENGILTMDINTALNWPNLFDNPPIDDTEFIGLQGQCSSTLNAPNPGGGTLGTTVNGNVYYDVELASCTPSPTTGGPNVPPDPFGQAPIAGPSNIIMSPGGGATGPTFTPQAGVGATGMAAKPSKSSKPRMPRRRMNERIKKVNNLKQIIKEAIRKLKIKKLKEQRAGRRSPSGRMITGKNAAEFMRNLEAELRNHPSGRTANLNEVRRAVYAYEQTGRVGPRACRRCPRLGQPITCLLRGCVHGTGSGIGWPAPW